MKFTCNTQLLNTSISNVLLAVSPKSTVLALEGIDIKAENNSIFMIGYNLDMGITTSIEAKVEESGEIIIPAKVFSDIVRRLDSDLITVECDSQCLIKITGGVSDFTILGMSCDEFPELPNIGKSNSFNISSEVLTSMISMTHYAVGVRDVKPVQTGCLFELNDGVLSIVAVDGFRMALRRENIDIADNYKFIVPGKTLNELLKLICDVENVKIEVSDKHILFDMGSCTLISRLLEGDFLDFNAAIPKESSTVITVNVRSFINSIERTSLLISDRIKSPLRINFDNSLIHLSSSTSIGKAYDECNCSINGNSLEMGFNNQFLLDALKNTDSDMVRLELNGPLSPMKILPLEGNHFIFLVLPMRLHND